MKQKNKLDIQTEVSKAMYAAQTETSKNVNRYVDSIEFFWKLGSMVCVVACTSLVALNAIMIYLHWPEILRFVATL